MRFRSTTIDSHDAAVAGASALPAAVAQFCRFGGTRVMNSTAIVVFGLLVATIGRAGQETNTSYSGKATIARLGMIAFPAGEWSLEFQRIQAPTNSPYLADYFVFKMFAERMERLTFLRYPPTVTPRQLGHMLDTIGETMGDGIPGEEKQSEDHGAGVIHPMRLMPASPTATERQIEYSFIQVRP